MSRRSHGRLRTPTGTLTNDMSIIVWASWFIRGTTIYVSREASSVQVILGNRDAMYVIESAYVAQLCMPRGLVSGVGKRLAQLDV